MRNYYPLLFLALFMPFLVRAQFTLNSTATPIAGSTGSNCFRLTNTDFHQKGSVFSTSKIDLTQNFTVNASLYFGTNDCGGDGIAFVLQAEGPNYIGNFGAGLGYHRFNGIAPSDIGADNPGPSPSLIIEFDTYQNSFIGNLNIGDPQNDHIGFMSNSNAYHTSPTQLQAPQQFSSNIEDGQWHDVVFSWNASTQTLTIQFTVSPGVVQTFTYTANIVTTLFANNALVHWGFTAANGTFCPNEHRVCIQTPPAGECGQLRTQTPGGWGAPPNGNNPATYMYGHFAAVFPSGLTVGLTPNYNIRLTSPQAVTNFLPSGGQAKALTQNYVNPTTVKNTLAGHLVALTLAVRFDAADPSFGAGSITLGDMIIGSGPFQGWTVNNFLVEANKVLGGGTSSYTVQEVLETAGSINENYVDGNMDNGFLDCPTAGPIGRPAPLVRADVSRDASVQAYPNPSSGQFELRFDSRLVPTQVTVVNANGTVVIQRNVGQNSIGNLKFDLSGHPPGMYLVKISSASGEKTQKLFVQ